MIHALMISAPQCCPPVPISAAHLYPSGPLSSAAYQCSIISASSSVHSISAHQCCLSV
ncbi:unnamed protein product, partial [Staurois parvus]